MRLRAHGLFKLLGIILPCLLASALPLLVERGVVIPSFSSLVPIPYTVLQLVKQRTRDSSHQSWELGVMAEAYLEIDWAQMSVYGVEGVPPPRSVQHNNNLDNITSILDIANYVIAIRPQGILPLIQDTSVGDPPSVGVAVLMANWTKGSRPDEALNDYDDPVRAQLGYLFDDAPKTVDGAISHRSEQVQLWADFIYMVPPFIAYYGALYEPYVNSWILYQSYVQIQLYRNYLFDGTVGLWMHIMLGDFQDVGHWSTGNGWAAAGIMRVLMTMNQTTLGYQPQFVAAQRDLQNWATEIVNNIWNYQQPSGALMNYATDGTTFPDAASTALLASVTLRLAALPVYLRGPSSNSTWDPTIADRYPAVNYTSLPAVVELSENALQAALRGRDYVIENLNTTDGWLANVVDPESFANPGAQSPESESFVLLMESAWRGWFDYISSS